MGDIDERMSIIDCLNPFDEVPVPYVEPFVDEIRRLRKERDAHCASLDQQEQEIDRQRAVIAETRADKDEAYRQRNHLVAALARLFPSGVRRTDIPGWSDDWHGCVYIDLPTGQISYHYHDSQGYLFADLPPYEDEYDGHDKDVVHARLEALAAATAAGDGGEDVA